MGGWFDGLRMILGWLSSPVRGTSLPWSGRTNEVIRWGTPDEDNPPLKTLVWGGRTNVLIQWAGPPEQGTMKQHRYPVRINSPQRFEYVFCDQDNDPIDLTAYDSVTLDLKRTGDAWDAATWSLEANFGDRTVGEVYLDGVGISPQGDWVAQFVCQIGTADSLFGEPIRLKLVKNVEDLTAEEIPEF